MLAAVRVAGEQQQSHARREDEEHADQRLLLLRRAPFGPSQQPGTEERRSDRGGLHGEAVLGDAERVGGDHAEPRDLRDREVDEDDAAIEHLHAERDVGREDEQPSDQGRAEDAPVEHAPVHGLVPAAATRRPTVSSKRPNRSFAASLPPTVNGTLTIAMPAFFAIHSEGRGSW